MQLGPDDILTLKMEPATGQFTLHPHSLPSLNAERRLNKSGKDPSEDGAACLENLRWHHLTEEITRKGRALGWIHVKSPITYDEARLSFKPRDAFNPVCFQRQGVNPAWYVMLVMSLHGDEWWAFKAYVQPPLSPKVAPTNEKPGLHNKSQRAPLARSRPWHNYTWALGSLPWVRISGTT